MADKYEDLLHLNLMHSKRHGTLLVARYRKYYEKCKIIIKGDFGILGGWPPCPPPKSAYAGELTDK